MNTREIKAELRNRANPAKAIFFPRFFKAGPGEYGEGDRFIGVTVPNARAVAKQFAAAPPGILAQLLRSPIHEERLCALLILVAQYERAEKRKAEPEKERLFLFYLANRKGVNNWYLVDLSAPRIVGAWLSERDKSLLDEFARSPNLWERRIAIVSTLYFIRRDDFGPTLRIAALLVNDREDLIHKASGWMLRELGKRNEEVLLRFLREHYADLPRTTLRYAIERFPIERRRSCLAGKFERGAGGR